MSEQAPLCRIMVPGEIDMAAATVPQVDSQEVSTATWSAEEIVRLGCSIYERDLRAYLESKELGRYIAINVLTGEYALADSAQEAEDQAFERWPSEVFYTVRVGYAATDYLL